MKNNKALGLIMKTLIFTVVFSLLFKWQVTGDPLHETTIFMGIVVFLQILGALFLGKIYFYRVMSLSIEQIRKKLLLYLILFLILLLFIFLIVNSIAVWLFYLIKGIDTTDFITQLLEVEIPGAIKYYAICSLGVSAVFFYKVWRQTVDKEQSLREENLKYQYRTLKAQVNPHFLFNSLNTLSELVYVDARQADNYIQKLSGIYRYILNHEETELVSLTEELEFVYCYFGLQKERYGSKVILDIDIPNPQKFKIIPVSLQILVENALKHNSALKDSPLEINVIKQDRFVVVSNNIQRKNSFPDSYGTGLANLNQRVKLITGNEIVVEQDNKIFTVKLPLIPSDHESINS